MSTVDELGPVLTKCWACDLIEAVTALEKLPDRGRGRQVNKAGLSLGTIGGIGKRVIYMAGEEGALYTAVSF